MRRPKKMGHFRFDAEIFEDEKTARAMYRGMIVYRVENNMALNTVDVWAVHPEFRDVNDEMLAEEFRRRGLRVLSANSLRCNSLGFLFGE